VCHQVAWIKADDKGILAMHDRVLTNNARLSVVHSDLHTWTLQIRDAHRSDRGQYMCQINSDPMRSQVKASHSHSSYCVPLHHLRIDNDTRNCCGTRRRLDVLSAFVARPFNNNPS
jgi:hypothetical protein